MRNKKGYMMSEITIWMVVFGIFFMYILNAQQGTMESFFVIKKKALHSMNTSLIHHSLLTDLKDHYDVINSDNDNHLILEGDDTIEYILEDSVLSKVVNGEIIYICKGSNIKFSLNTLHNYLEVTIYTKGKESKLGYIVPFEKIGGE